VRVSAPYAAVVRRVDAAPGAPVVRGAPIALLAPVGGLMPKVAKAEAELVATEHDRARQEDLHARGEPQRDVDDALDRVRVARARAAQARAAAAWAANADAGAPSDDIAREYSLLVLAPCDGVVLAAPDPGARVNADAELFLLGEPAAK